MTRMDLFGIKPMEDLAYRAWVADRCRLGVLRCVICGMPAVGHHVRSKRVYGDRSNLVPLCDGMLTGHHTRAKHAVHQMGRKSFEKKFRHEIPDGLQAEADKLDALYASEEQE